MNGIGSAMVSGGIMVALAMVIVGNARRLGVPATAVAVVIWAGLGLMMLGQAMR